MTASKVFLCIAVLLLVATSAFAQNDEGKSAEGKRVAERKPRSILQACRSELPTLCKERKDLMRCLGAKEDQVKDETCKSWLAARSSCNEYVKKSGKCQKQSPRVCLRGAKEEDLPAACAQSAYYKSVKLFGAFRQVKRTLAPKPAK